MDRKKIVVLGTGGTIAGTAANAADNTGYRAAQKGVAELLAAIPALAQLPFVVVCEQVAQIDSKDMEMAVLQQLLLRCAHWLAQPDVLGLVITHGTDTLEETAYFLHATLAADKPVVLTCAMRPATAISADGPQNLLDAMVVASHAGAHGVMVVCAGAVHAALDVQKVHTYRLDAFSSGDAGALGYVEAGAVRLVRSWPRVAPGAGPAALDRVVAVTEWPRVELVISHAGANGAIVDALLAHGAAPGVASVRGVVVAATGNGTLHQALEDALLQAQAAGVRVVLASRCADGHVLPRPGAAFPDSQGLPPVKARLALMLNLV